VVWDGGNVGGVEGGGAYHFLCFLDEVAEETASSSW
jgi:hypothetical protein